MTSGLFVPKILSKTHFLKFMKYIMEHILQNKIRFL